MKGFISDTLKRNINFNPYVDQGIWTLKDTENANESGSIGRDPYLGNVEFLFKFEEPNGSRDYKNSIPNDKWFLWYTHVDKSGTYGPGSVSTSRSKFGNSSYFNGVSKNDANWQIGNGLFYNSILALGYEDFTLECWVNFTTLSQNNSSIFQLGGGNSGAGSGIVTTDLSSGFNLYLNSSGVLLLSAAGQTLSSGTTPFVINTWHHVALVRRDGVLRVFVDGTARISSVANANTLATTSAETGYCFLPGNLKLFHILYSNTFYADEARLTRNVARYWNNFTPPLSEFPAPTQLNNNNVIALIKFDDPNIIRNSAGWGKDFIKLPSQVTTNNKKFGNSSLQPDSFCSFHYIDSPTKIGTGDFNISCWINPSAIGGANGFPIFSLNRKISLILGGAEWAEYNKSGQITASDKPFEGRLSLVYDSSTTPITANMICQTAKNAVSLNAWQHVLVSRKNHIYRIFVNGVLQATGNIWTTTTVSPTNNTWGAWNGLAYGNNTYVMVGSYQDQRTGSRTQTRYLTSTDALSWTERTLPLSRQWASVIYANNQFTAIAYGSDTIAHSSDAVNWTTATLPSYTYNTKSGVQTQTNNGWFRVAYGNSTYVAIGNPIGSISRVVATSTDGTTWTARTEPGGSDFRDLVFLNGEFLILGNSRIYRSSNGVTWTSTNGTTTNMDSIAYGNNIYVTTSPESSGYKWVYTSTNLSTFTKRNLPATRFGGTFDGHAIWSSKVYFLNNKFYLFAQDATSQGGHRFAAFSDDGISWNFFSVPHPSRYTIYTNKFVGIHGLTGSSNPLINGITSDPLSLDIDKTYLIIGGYGGGGTTSGGYTFSETGGYGKFMMDSHFCVFGSSSGSNTTSIANPWGWYRMEGFIDEFIIDKNTGIDANFTPPTTSLPDTRYA